MTSPTPGLSRRTDPAVMRRVAAVWLLTALAGCVSIDGVLKPDGSGTLEVVYGVLPTSTEGLERRRFASPSVTLESLKLNGDGTATAKLSFDDPAKLSTLEMFRSVKITRQREKDEERVTITVKNQGTPVKDEGKPGPRIHLTLPGKVLQANRGATVDGNSVTWRFGLAEFVNQREVEITARYLVPADPASRSAPDVVPADH